MTVVEVQGLWAKEAPVGDAPVVLQLGRQKHGTTVATQKGSCHDGQRSACSSCPRQHDSKALLLQLTIMQCMLVSADHFLGRATLPLATLLESGCTHPVW